MKKIFLIVITVLITCCQNSKKNDINSKKQVIEESVIAEFGPIKLDTWELTPHVKGYLASQLDIDEGRAVFLIDPEGGQHLPLDIKIPSLASLIDEESKEKKIVVVIQGEKIDTTSIIGIRYLSGGDGVCTLEELTFIENVEDLKN